MFCEQHWQTFSDQVRIQHQAQGDFNRTVWIDPVICCSRESGSGTAVFDSPGFILGYQVAMKRSVLDLFLDFLATSDHVQPEDSDLHSYYDERIILPLCPFEEGRGRDAVWWSESLNPLWSYLSSFKRGVVQILHIEVCLLASRRRRWLKLTANQWSPFLRSWWESKATYLFMVDSHKLNLTSNKKLKKKSWRYQSKYHWSLQHREQRPHNDNMRATILIIVFIIVFIIFYFVYKLSKNSENWDRDHVFKQTPKTKNSSI